ncbi:MAG: hypothetical protein LBE47_00340 [Methanomassiliicoccaceae archaeon]|jgi:hypothetical protein|nr:hypothetical protein [Methanomassiliicoccaceae archaeon]
MVDTKIIALALVSMLAVGAVGYILWSDDGADGHYDRGFKDGLDEGFERGYEERLMKTQALFVDARVHLAVHTTVGLDWRVATVFLDIPNLDIAKITKFEAKLYHEGDLIGTAVMEGAERLEAFINAWVVNGGWLECMFTDLDEPAGYDGPPWNTTGTTPWDRSACALDDVILEELSVTWNITYDGRTYVVSG